MGHVFTGKGIETGTFNKRRGRHGRWFEYFLDTHGEKRVVVVATYNGGNRDRKFDVLVNGVHLATEQLKARHPSEFFVKHYKIPAAVLSAKPDGKIVIKFTSSEELAGDVFDVRLMRSDEPDRETGDPDMNTHHTHHPTEERICCSKERI